MNQLRWILITLRGNRHDFGFRSYFIGFGGLSGKIGGLLVSRFRIVIIAHSLYIDDLLKGKIFASEGYWSGPISQRGQGFSFQAVEALNKCLFVLVAISWYVSRAFSVP